MDENRTRLDMMKVGEIVIVRVGRGYRVNVYSNTW